MAREEWPLHRGRPCVRIVLELAISGQLVSRTLLADTGAGSVFCGFDLLLDEDDCLNHGGYYFRSVKLGGAYTGFFPIYGLPVRIPSLGFEDDVSAVGVPSPPMGFDGIAAFPFLYRFHYGNFATSGSFGLES